jgi:phosphate transport system substrate-binding protein
MGFSIRSATRKGALVAFLGTMALTPIAAAQDSTPIPYTAPDDIAEISGTIEADGSSTVGPVTEAVIEEFAAVAPEISVTNGVSGTGGGFERFTIGEIPIANASRAIAEDEVALAAENGIDYYRLDIAYDGISVVVSAENDFIETLTVEQLAQLWGAEGGVTNWSDLDPSWPEEPVELYGPGADSGTFDFFNEAILGEDLAPRTDYNPSEDDNVLVEGVAGSPNALGYFGFAFYEANADSLRLVPIDAGDGPVEPSVETIGDGSYAPLSRPLFIYVNAESLQSDPALQEFLRFYLASSADLSADVGYVALPAEIGVEQQSKLEGAISGEVEPDSASAGATPEGTPAT